MDLVLRYTPSNWVELGQGLAPVYSVGKSLRLARTLEERMRKSEAFPFTILRLEEEKL